MANFCAALEAIVHRDYGERGLQALFESTRGNYEVAARMLLEEDHKRIGIITGFNLPPQETDGPPGALFLARCLQNMKKSISFLTAHYCRGILQAGLQELALDFPIHCVHNDTDVNAFYEQYPFDLLCSIEVVGPSRLDGRCRRAKGNDTTELQDGLWQLFEMAPSNIKKISIGDGGNELGCGNLSETIFEHSKILFWDKIACRSTCDVLLMSGVSNWGAYALGLLSLRLAYQTRSNTDQLIKFYAKSSQIDILTVDSERSLLRCIMAAGAQDPKYKDKELAVDGLLFSTVHSLVIEELSNSFTSFLELLENGK
jgi:D-glutamate cyclase